MAILKQSTAYNRMVLIVGSSDHITGLTGATLTVTISKNGAAFAALGGSVTEIGTGWYKLALNTTDTATLGDLAYHITAASADPTDLCDQVCANILGDTLPANATQFAGQTITAAAGVTIPSSIASPTNITAGTITTVTTVTNQLTAAQIATGVWQDTTSGDFTTTSSIGKSLYTSGVAPGGTNGLFIAGTNAATTITTGLTTTFTGNLTGSVASVTGAVGSVTGNVGGSVASVTGAVGSVTGAVGSVTGAVGSVTGSVGSVTGLTNATIATAVWTDTTAGDFTTLTSPGKIIFAQLGGAFTTTSSSVYSTASLANAPTGGSAPTVSQIATAVWQDLLSGSDFSTTGSIGNLLKVAIPNAAAGSTGGIFIAGTNAATTITGSLTTAFTGNLTGSVASVTSPVTVGTINASASNIKKNTALANFMFIMTDATTHNPKTGLTVTGTVALDSGIFNPLTNAVSEVGSGWYRVNLAAGDLNGNVAALRFTATSSDDRDILIVTQA